MLVPLLVFSMALAAAGPCMSKTSPTVTETCHFVVFVSICHCGRNLSPLLAFVVPIGEVSDVKFHGSLILSAVT